MVTIMAAQLKKNDGALLASWKQAAGTGRFLPKL
jgi:hypothetical protein